MSLDSICLRAEIVLLIGSRRILDSQDPAFNDIPLKRWDDLHGLVLAAMPKAFRDAVGENNSLGFTVCVAKAAARQFRNAYHAKPNSEFTK